MNEEAKIDPKHSGTRRFLRTAGPVVVGLRLLLTVIGIGRFFLFRSGRSGRPVAFLSSPSVGVPLLFVGG